MTLVGFMRAKEAVSALEYAVLVGVVVAGVGGAVAVFSDNVADTVEEIGTAVDGASTDAIDLSDPN